MREVSRREFFTSCSKDVLKDVVRSWHSFSGEMNQELKKEERELSCEDVAIAFFRKNSGKGSLKPTMFSTNRKEGKKI